MATDITLYIGPDPHAEARRFTDPHKWEAVKSQIVNALNMGKGTIEIPVAENEKVVYVYSPTLHIAWVDRSTP